MSWLTCNKIFRGKSPHEMSDRQRKKLRERLQSAAAMYQSNPTLVKTKYANDAETMEWLWNKFTGKELDFDFNPIKISDVRKFEHGIRWFEKNLIKRSSKSWNPFEWLKISKATTRKFPELEEFQENLSQETGHYRNVTIKGNLLANEIIKGFEFLAKRKGGDINRLRQLEGILQREMQKPYKLQNRKGVINPVEKELATFLKNESSSAVFRHFNSLMNGLDVNQLGTGKVKYSPEEMQVWRTIDKNMTDMREMGVKVLAQAVRKVMNTAKILDSREQGVRNLESTVREARDMIKRLEFQSEIDTGPGRTKNEMKWFDDLTALGFRKGEGPVVLKKYMPLYVIGATKLLRQMDLEMRKGDPSQPTLREALKDDIDSFRKSTTRIMERGNIQDARYTQDPAFFLKKYVHDIATYNFQTHLENSYWKQMEKLLDMHAKGKSEDNKDIMQLSENLIKQMNEMKDAVMLTDPNSDTMINDLSRLMTSVTYLRLMGGNLRSAARNATQRIYEIIEFGAGATWGARKWRQIHDNEEMLKKQAKRFGLSWYINEGAGLFGRSRDLPIEEATRGAITESMKSPKGTEINDLGELVMSESGKSERKLKRTADAASFIAGKAGVAHRVIEDWNRAGTFGTAYAITYQNLQKAPKSWLLKKMGWKPGEKMKSDEQIEAFRQNKAGRMAYNLTTDLHYEYAKWAKSKAFTGPIGQAGGQFMHYRLSMMDMLYKWITDAGISMKSGDFTSDEVWKVARLGMAVPIIEGMSLAFNMNLARLAQNDVISEMDRLWDFFFLDREDPVNAEEIEKETFGQGYWSFMPVNIAYAANVGEAAGLWNLGENSYWKDQEIIQGNDKFTQFQRWKSMSLISAAGARWSQYTLPMLFKRGLWDATRFELGLMPDKKWKEMRGFLGAKAKEEIPYELREKFNLDSWSRGMKSRTPRVGMERDVFGGMTAFETKNILQDMDYMKGEKTPAQVKNKRRMKKRDDLAYNERVLESLTFMESLP